MATFDSGRQRYSMNLCASHQQPFQRRSHTGRSRRPAEGPLRVQKAKCSLRAYVFSCCLDNRHAATAAPCPFGANSGLMHCSKQRLYSITSSARVRRQLNSTPSLRTVSACARSPIIVANACSSASSPRASAGTSVNLSGPAASRVDFRRSRLGAKSGAARRLGAKPRRSAKADIVWSRGRQGARSASLT